MVASWLIKKLRRFSRTRISPRDGSTREVFGWALEGLTKKGQQEYCSFEVVSDSDVWFQVTEPPGLSIGNFAWPVDGDPLAKIRELNIAFPSVAKVVEDQRYSNRRVVTIDCGPMSTSAWVDIIDAVFQRLHRLPPDYCIKGWV